MRILEVVLPIEGAGGPLRSQGQVENGRSAIVADYFQKQALPGQSGHMYCGIDNAVGARMGGG